MITWYGDEIAINLDDPNIRNYYLTQHIPNSVNDIQHFTGQPQIDFAIFKYFDEQVEFKPFDQYAPGKSIVAIGLHGGLHPLKLQLIKEWFYSSTHRMQAWNDPNCNIILDYSLEGFTDDYFPELWTWINENDLTDRVLYVNGACNLTDLYIDWCAKQKCAPNMQTAWYGFFTNWLVNDRISIKVNGEYSHINSALPMAKCSDTSKRYLSLNRRPHPHRVLLTTLLERKGIIGNGTVSMPLEFSEPEVQWDKEHWDLSYQWFLLNERFNGRLSYLDDDFKSLFAKLPLIADTNDFGTNYAMDLNVDFYNNYPINIVTETLFFTDAAFTSEKIWKPMLLGQIFLVLASPLYLQALRDLGFKTFNQLINEDYDTIIDPLDRANALANTLKDIVNLSNEKFAELLENCKPIIAHNREIVVDQERLTKLVSAHVVDLIENSWNYKNI